MTVYLGTISDNRMNEPPEYLLKTDKSLVTKDLITYSAYLYPLFLSFESPRVLLKKNGREIYLPLAVSQVNKGDKL